MTYIFFRESFFENLFSRRRLCIEIYIEGFTDLLLDVIFFFANLMNIECRCYRVPMFEEGKKKR